MVSSGRYRDRVTIETRTPTNTALGVSESWVAQSTHWASVVADRYRMRDRHLADRSEAIYQIFFRTPVTLDAKDYRFVWDGKTLVPTEPAIDLGTTGAGITRIRAMHAPGGGEAAGWV
jgi:head-tail adaptor